MSRPIKFRAWDKEEKEYYYNAEYTYDFFCSSRGCYAESFGEVLDQPKRFVVEQYTGLKDKNGKEIYEGDIVYDIYTGDEVFIVGWDKDKASFMLADTADYPMAYFDEYKLDKDLEVIGNVHENPELLGGKE